MSKISFMGVAGFDPVTREKRVVWRPDTSTTVIKIGQPVCYNSDLAADYKERTTNPITANAASNRDGIVYAEGSQNYNARLFIVEEPLTANLHAFAGIVKSLGTLAGADGDFIDIYIPVEGSVVPVFTAQNCILDRTIMGIQNSEADVNFPGRPIGVAIETKDRSTTDGLVWMKFKNFEYETINGGGDATANALIVDDEAAANAVAINARNVRFDGTGRARMLYYVGELNGAGHSAYGMFKFRTYVSAALSQDAHTICANLHFKDNAELPAQGNPEYASAPLYVTVETEVTSAAPDLSGGNLAAIYVGYYINEGVGAPAKAHVICCNDSLGANMGQWDGLLRVKNFGGIGDANVANATTQESASDRYLPISLGETTYYLRAYLTAQ